MTAEPTTPEPQPDPPPPIVVRVMCPEGSIALNWLNFDNFVDAFLHVEGCPHDAQAHGYQLHANIPPRKCRECGCQPGEDRCPAPTPACACHPCTRCEAPK